ncbi:hypothetical protein V8C44DRAFT_323777 [Trichoderma aethiopicum]
MHHLFFCLMQPVIFVHHVTASLPLQRTVCVASVSRCAEEQQAAMRQTLSCHCNEETVTRTQTCHEAQGKIS